MKSFIYLLLLVTAIVCQEEHGCADKCPCPDIRSFARVDPEKMPITEGPGCLRTVSCPNNYASYATFFFSNDSIPAPADLVSNFPYGSAMVNRPENVRRVDIFDLFGMTCQNGTWYLTRYPDGITYIDIGTVNDVPLVGNFDGIPVKLRDYIW